MHNSTKISLNAFRVFVAVADSGSLKLAAAQLGVTPGAVSRQIQNLETTMGVLLFHRTNNAIRLTDIGDTFLRQALPGLNILNRSIEMAMGDGRDVSVQVPTTLATRWLIPLLGGFKKRWPDITVKVETYSGNGLPKGSRSDVTVAYFPIIENLHNAETLIEDRCRPYLSPHLLSLIKDNSDLSSIPALQCSAGNWDWNAWLKESGQGEVLLRYEGHFDLDDVALRAAVASMGMVLAPEFIIRDDLEAGRLCALPNAPEVLLGYYTLHTVKPITSTTATFTRWLRKIQ